MFKRLWCVLTGHNPFHEVDLDNLMYQPDGYLLIKDSHCVDCGKELKIQYTVRHEGLERLLDWHDISHVKGWYD